MADDQSDVVLSKAKAVTSSLGKSRQALNSTVQRTDDLLISLSKDGQYLQDSLQEHKVNLKGGLSKTKIALDKIKTAEKNEKRKLLLSLIFFGSVVVYIILKRTRILTLLAFTAKTVIYTGKLFTSTNTSLDQVNHPNEDIADTLSESPIPIETFEYVCSNTGYCHPIDQIIEKDIIYDESRYTHSYDYTTSRYDNNIPIDSEYEFYQEYHHDDDAYIDNHYNNNEEINIQDTQVENDMNTNDDKFYINDQNNEYSSTDTDTVTVTDITYDNNNALYEDVVYQQEDATSSTSSYDNVYDTHIVHDIYNHDNQQYMDNENSNNMIFEEEEIYTEEVNSQY